MRIDQHWPDGGNVQVGIEGGDGYQRGLYARQ
jgi:hypothetical protein